MALSTQPYKGARDFYPEDKRVQKYIFNTIRKVVEGYGYEEYDAPLLEPIELYLAKTGDEIVNEQTYAFEDRGGRKIAIRPEMTPTVSRMVAAKRQELAYPLRWYNIGPRLRYERPQRGRLREFFQLDVDLFGIEDIAADEEIIRVADAVLQGFKATRKMYEIRINSRQLMDKIFKEYLKVTEVQALTLMKLIDRQDKMEPAEFLAEASLLFSPTEREQGLDKQFLELLEVRELRNLPDKLARSQEVKDLGTVIDSLESSGVSNVRFDPSIMRGFDYYTGIVFEVYDTDPENNRSMFGGGRYDGLVGLFNVTPVSSVGFAMGDVTLTNFLQKHELMPATRTETDVLVVPVGDVSQLASGIARELRQMGLNVVLGQPGQKLDKQIKMAVKKGIRYALFVGQKEIESQQFVLRDLEQGNEETHGLQRIVSIVKDYRQG